MALGQFIDHDLDHVPVFSKFTNFFSSLADYNGAQTVYYLVSWESVVIPLVTPFFKRAYKISYPPQL